MSLSGKKCAPCDKGASALAAEEARLMLAEVPGWSISADGTWLEKKYKFKNFSQALAFVNKVGAVAEAENHHPDVTLGWGYAGIRLQTHSVGGLHQNDFIVAAKIGQIQ